MMLAIIGGSINRASIEATSRQRPSSPDEKEASRAGTLRGRRRLSIGPHLAHRTADRQRHFPTFSRRLPAGVEHHLRLQRHLAPVGVDPPGGDERREVAEQVHLLGRGVAVAVLGDVDEPRAAPHVEVAARDLEHGVRDLEPRLLAEEREHEVGHVDDPLRAAHVRPLLVLGPERAVEAGRDAVAEEQLAGHLRRDRRRRFRRGPAAASSRAVTVSAARTSSPTARSRSCTSRDRPGSRAAPDRCPCGCRRGRTRRSR